MVYGPSIYKFSCSVSIAVHFRQMRNVDYYGDYLKTIFVLAVVFGLMSNVIEFINLGLHISFVFNIVYHIVFFLSNLLFWKLLLQQNAAKAFLVALSFFLAWIQYTSKFVLSLWNLIGLSDCLFLKVLPNLFSNSIWLCLLFVIWRLPFSSLMFANQISYHFLKHKWPESVFRFC